MTTSTEPCCPLCRAPLGVTVSQLLAGNAARGKCPSCGFERRGFSGEVGQCWVNDTEKVYYQFTAPQGGCCGYCFQHERCVGPYWGMPFHRQCDCRQKPIRPGESSLPFVNFQEELNRFTEEQRHALIGRSNWQLLAGGLAKWTDVVGSTTVCDFAHVVNRLKLTPAAMLSVGISAAEVDEAWNRIYTPERLARDAKLRELHERLRAAGLSITVEVEGRKPSDR